MACTTGPAPGKRAHARSAAARGPKMADCGARGRSTARARALQVTGLSSEAEVPSDLPDLPDLPSDSPVLGYSPYQTLTADQPSRGQRARPMMIARASESAGLQMAEAQPPWIRQRAKMTST